MPVYERGYRHWEHSGGHAAPAWWAIARRGIAEPLKRRGFLLLLVVAWVPAVVKAGILYFTWKVGELARLLGGSWTDITPEGFRAFLFWQGPFVLIVLALIGARLVTRDREENGLALYFARPLTLIDYVAGKTAIILFFYFAVTLFPVYALSVFGYLVTSGDVGVEMLLLVPLRATAFCILSGVSLALILLALSSLGRRTVFVVLWWVLLYAGSDGLADIMAMFDARLEICNFPGMYENLGSLFFSAEPALTSISPWFSLLQAVILTLAAVAVLRRRIRPVEVVS